ncbi:MAG: FAD-dependent oxidoreductase [Lachnospiraceae bacterium]|nr:FAD-dependent oxidoreductase [Lachnospiraceae bacterium]
MKKVLIIGSGIAGLTCAIECAQRGMKVTLVSPFPSERAQSVLAAGGINAVLDNKNGDSIASHIEDTLKGGCSIAGRDAVKGLCEDAPDIIRWLERIGTVFTTDAEGRISQRAFGGQSFNRTCYCGSSTGKQIVTALIMEARRLEGKGLIDRRIGLDFYSALIRDEKCHGALLFNRQTGRIEAVTADITVAATGGMNSLFRMSTGSSLCDGYVAGKLFTQGVELKNLEFIQYHPTTIITGQKRMLISEAARGEGGRLYYEENGSRVYFMEDRFGERGNLMPRDVVSRCIDETGRDVFLDVSFLGRERILQRIPEVYELCRKYRGIDISRQSIPVCPSVHFFMGGIAVDNGHETRIKDLYAIGECASIYHGANRLGGNSLLAAIHGARAAAASMEKRANSGAGYDPSQEMLSAKEELEALEKSQSTFPVMYIRDLLAATLQEDLGISRNASRLEKGLEDVSYYLSIAEKIRFDSSEPAYLRYSLKPILTLAKAVLLCAESRKESRGAHLRSDFPETKEDQAVPTVISHNKGSYDIYMDREGRYES